MLKRKSVPLVSQAGAQTLGNQAILMSVRLLKRSVNSPFYDSENGNKIVCHISPKTPKYLTDLEIESRFLGSSQFSYLVPFFIL